MPLSGFELNSPVFLSWPDDYPIESHLALYYIVGMAVANRITLNIVLYSRNGSSHAWVFMMWFLTLNMYDIVGMTVAMRGCLWCGGLSHHYVVPLVRQWMCRSRDHKSTLPVSCSCTLPVSCSCTLPVSCSCTLPVSCSCSYITSVV